MVEEARTDASCLWASVAQNPNQSQTTPVTSFGNVTNSSLSMSNTITLSFPRGNQQVLLPTLDRDVQSNELQQDHQAMIPVASCELRSIYGVQCFVPVSAPVPLVLESRYRQQDYSHCNLATYDHVKAWNLMFSGNRDEDVKLFLNEVKINKDVCNMGNDDIFRVMPILLKGIAMNWWLVHQNTFRSYEEFCQALIYRFSDPEMDKCRVVRDIVVRTQGDKEKGLDYVDNVRRMWSLSGDANFPEAARLDIAYFNLRREYIGVISRRDFRSFDELGELVRDFDRRRNLPKLAVPPTATESIYGQCAYVPPNIRHSFLNSESMGYGVDAVEVSADYVSDSE